MLLLLARLCLPVEDIYWEVIASSESLASQKLLPVFVGQLSLVSLFPVSPVGWASF